MKRIVSALTVTTIAILALVSLFGIQPSVASYVDPVFVDGNPSCTDLGYSAEFKVDPPSAGTYPVPGAGSVTVTTDGIYFDWTSTFGIDAVIAKGGPNANVYVYDPPAESFGDTGLHSPINIDQPFGLSHISFCFDYSLDVSKDALTAFTRTWEWEIEKSVDPDTWDLFTGDSGTSQYTVEVTKTGYTDSDWAVSGSIVIENNTPFAATITGVTDNISGLGDVVPDCGVSFPYELAANDSLICAYSTALPDGSNRENTATVTTSGAVDGGQHTVPVEFGAPTTEVNAEITVDDTNLEELLGPVSESDSWNYEQTFTCAEDEGENDNTATIVETGQNASATVTVNCHELEVFKDVHTSFTRTWQWEILKSADQTELLLSEGQLFQVNYEVTVDATYLDSDYAASGDIEVSNPAPIAATINSVSDVVSPDIVADVDCGVAFPYQLLAGDTLNCSYSVDLPDDADRTNTATAALQNYDYDFEGGATPAGTTDFSFAADVDFSNATMTEIDECIDVTDTNVGFLGTVCADNIPGPFNYSLWFGLHPDADVLLECDENIHINIASFETNDTATTGEDDETVNAVVACDLGCSLTPGYWKTHSSYGPAPYDDTWALIGEDTAFFGSGQSYYQVLWTAPQGNAYYILAHAYIAAQLNELNGADFTDAQAAFDAATLLFQAYDPGDVAGLKGPAGNALRAQFIELAQILDDYNNGLIGPGHCTE